MEQIDINFPVRFLSAGQFVAGKGWMHQRRICDSNVLFLVESGQFVIHVGATRYELGPHEAILLPSGREHAGEVAEDKPLPTYYWAHFNSCKDYSGQRMSLPIYTRVKDYNEMIVAFHQLISESRSDMPRELMCDYFMSILLMYVSNIREDLSEDKRLYIRVKEHIRTHYRNKISLADLSEKFHYSGDYLSRMFKKNSGISINNYIHSLRLKEAKQLLLTTTDSVKEIGFRCGYTNQQFFITTFIKFENMSPTQYRNLFGRFHQNDR